MASFPNASNNQRSARTFKRPRRMEPSAAGAGPSNPASGSGYFFFCDRASNVTVVPPVVPDGMACHISNSHFIQCGSNCMMIVDGSASCPPVVYRPTPPVAQPFPPSSVTVTSRQHGENSRTTAVVFTEHASGAGAISSAAPPSPPKLTKPANPPASPTPAYPSTTSLSSTTASSWTPLYSRPRSGDSESSTESEWEDEDADTRPRGGADSEFYLDFSTKKWQPEPNQGKDAASHPNPEAPMESAIKSESESEANTDSDSDSNSESESDAGATGETALAAGPTPTANPTSGCESESETETESLCDATLLSEDEFGSDEDFLVALPHPPDAGQCCSLSTSGPTSADDRQSSGNPPPAKPPRCPESPLAQPPTCPEAAAAHSDAACQTTNPALDEEEARYEAVDIVIPSTPVLDALDIQFGMPRRLKFPVPPDPTHENVTAVVKFLKLRRKYEPLVFLEYFYQCAHRVEETAGPQSFARQPFLSRSEFGLLRYALSELQGLFMDVPQIPVNIHRPFAFSNYITTLVNKFKPLVRRSEKLYQILGLLVHLRIRTRAASFREWMQSPDVKLDAELVKQLHTHERRLLDFFEGLEYGPARRFMERGLQSALKYEEFYLRPFGGYSLESVNQMYTRIAGFLACHATDCQQLIFGRPATWFELFLYFFQYLYDHKIVPSTPAMLNLGRRNYYTSSCYLVNPQTTTNKATLDALTHNVKDILAQRGGVGLCLQSFNDAHRKQASLMPALKVLDSLVAAYNHASRRPTGVCVYIEPWHSDIMSILRMKGVLAGEEAQRCDNLFSALWMPDLFFKRLIRHLEGETGVLWTLFDKAESMALSDFHGQEFENLYEVYEQMGLGNPMPIQDVAFAIVRSAATTGSPFIMFKDAVNRHYIYDTQGAAISGSNLCTEIVHPADKDSSGVCNLGSVNLAACVVDGVFSFDQLRQAVQACVLMVNVMIDCASQPTIQCRRGHDRFRSMGIGMQGLHTAALMLGLDMTSEAFRELNKHIAEVMLLAAMKTSNGLCRHGAEPFAEFGKSMYRAGRFHWERFPDAKPRYEGEWDLLRQSMMRFGLRNSQFIALMPTVTSSQVSEVSEGFAPLFTNMFSKVTKEGELLRPNILLLRELRKTFGGKRLLDVLDKLDSTQWSVEKALPCLAPNHPLRKFKTAFDYDQTLLIDLCADRAPYVDHSQSMTLYVSESANGTLPASTLTRLLIHAYKRGLKTGMYYCKVRKATNSGVFGGDENLVCTSCVL
ncbi:ribonucleotide reductase subunit 1 [Pteropodid alphaherpesvirus 1]|uniref:Ribonucleoside-diphosphate reductase large subunit n=1 Tax=Pteropodid alphaherpesvirus 1 TaxID=1343901 RepID=A0A060PYA7_9ALPH|nr:ribonucleotide reductase subunit 1 [Pteropodid alphaherpesvirus 1]BAP00718.1 ribonucleotide reductase subunit 1 [Pteropodid alphaherpesvirus 1]